MAMCLASRGSMAPPAPSKLPDSGRWFQVRCERSAAEGSSRSPVQIENAGSPGAGASSAQRETRPTGDSRAAARANEGATSSVSTDRYTNPPSRVRQGRHVQYVPLEGSLPGVPTVRIGRRSTMRALFEAAVPVVRLMRLIPLTHR